jgi:LAGLIDADG DNA endonuclease family protein
MCCRDRRPTQGRADPFRVAQDPHVALRRLAPDPVQFQVILGSLLGDGQLVGASRQRRLRVAHRVERGDYVLWKYDRLGPFSAESPREHEAGLLGFETVSHPLFDDLSRLFGNRFARHDVIERLLRPLGLAVWLCDIGRLELRSDAFLPAQRDLALAG